jgi:hypothetical protein
MSFLHLLYLLQEVHSSICRHCKATDPIHRRELDFPLVSRRKSCLLVHGGVTVYGTHPRVCPDGWEVHLWHIYKQCRDCRHTVTRARGLEELTIADPLICVDCQHVNSTTKDWQRPRYACHSPVGIRLWTWWAPQQKGNDNILYRTGAITVHS